MLPIAYCLVMIVYIYEVCVYMYTYHVYIYNSGLSPRDRLNWSSCNLWSTLADNYIVVL